MAFSNISTLTAMVLVVVFMASTATAQETCASDLLPCADYLNSTKLPSTDCCTAINETVSTKLRCLCNLYLTPGLLQSLGANLTSALRIATACGVDSVGVDRCKSVLGEAPAVSPPTAVPGGDNSGSVRIASFAWTGLPALLLFWGAIMYY